MIFWVLILSLLHISIAQDARDIINLNPILNCSDETNVPLFQKEKILDVKFDSAVFNPLSYVDKPWYEMQEILFAGTLAFNQENIQLIMQPRGNNRYDICDHKPIKLIFDKENKPKLFKHANEEIKVVRGCEKNDVIQNKKVLREYQQYKMLECLGLPHLKVRLFHGKFYDNAKLQHKSYGFFIEPAKDLKQRCGKDSQLLKAQDFVMPQKQMAISNASLFHYNVISEILGHYDTHAEGAHNAKRIIKDGLDVSVPYDFDLTEVTNSLLKHNIDFNNGLERSFESQEMSLENEALFKKQITCPEMKRLLTRKEACTKSIDDGPLNFIDKKLFHRLNLRIHEQSLNYLNENKRFCN